MVLEDFLQIGRLIEYFSDVELVNTEATLAQDFCDGRSLGK